MLRHGRADGATDWDLAHRREMFPTTVSVRQPALKSPENSYLRVAPWCGSAGSGTHQRKLLIVRGMGSLRKDVESPSACFGTPLSALPKCRPPDSHAPSKPIHPYEPRAVSYLCQEGVAMRFPLWHENQVQQQYRNRHRSRSNITPQDSLAPKTSP